MRYGINTFLWTANFDAGSVPLLPRIKEMGFDGFEVPIFDPKTFAAKEIRKGAEQYGLGVTVCSIFMGEMSLAHDTAEGRRAAVNHLKDCASAIAEAGGALYVGPMYTPLGWKPGRRRTEDEWKRVVEGLQQAAPALASVGVTLAIEPLNRFETFFLNTVADGVALCDAVNHPNIGLLVDTFHSNIEEKNVGAAYRLAARHLKHVHTCENDRGTPGSGNVGWAEVFAALKEIRYDGWLTIESFGSSIKEIAAAACIWRDLAPTPDSIAVEGLAYLKKNMA
ncbi:MAG: sugar phosphate isomerase/epimerase [Bryobacter sp.]|nr:sugar phosphate isomerase/epimerase [Bryobacter sp.]